MHNCGSKDQRGVAHLGLILVAVVVLAGVGFAGYKVANKDKKDSASTGSVNSSVKATSDKEIEKACLAEIKDKNLCKFAAQHDLEDVPYATKISTTSSEGNTTLVMETDGKDNTFIVASEEGKELYSQIFLNGVSYMKEQADNTWTKYPKVSPEVPPGSDPISDITSFKTKSFKDSTVQYKDQGKEDCGKLTCFKYQVVDTTTPSTELFMLFDTKNYMLQRWSSKDAEGTTDMIFTYKAITIKEPSPVKEFNASSTRQ